MKIKFHTADRKTVSDMCLNSEEESYRGEMCCSFKGEIVSTIHIRYSSGSSVFVEEGLQPKELDDSSTTSYNKCLSFIKTICKEKHMSSRDNSFQGDPTIVHVMMVCLKLDDNSTRETLTCRDDLTMKFHIWYLPII